MMMARLFFLLSLADLSKLIVFILVSSSPSPDTLVTFSALIQKRSAPSGPWAVIHPASPAAMECAKIPPVFVMTQAIPEAIAQP